MKSEISEKRLFSQSPWQNVSSLLQQRGDHEPEGVEHRESAGFLLAAAASSGIIALPVRTWIVLLDWSVMVHTLRHGLGSLSGFSHLWNLI